MSDDEGGASAAAAGSHAITEHYVRVTDNEKKTDESGHEYVAFRVESYLKRDVGKEDLNAMVVWRRYTDFELFRSYLVSTIPSAVIPPIPEKTFNFKISKLAVDKFDKDMLKKRQEGFQRFMSRLMNHPRITLAPIVKHFVHEQDWREHLVIRRGNKVEKWSATGVNDSMAASVDKFEMTFKRGTKAEPGIGNELNYCNLLKDSVMALLNVHQKLLQTMHLIEANLTEFGDGLHQMRAVGSGAELDGFKELSERFDAAAGTVLQLAQQEELQFNDPFREYALYTEAVKEILLFQWRLSDGLTSKEQDIMAKQRSIDQWEKPEGITGFFRSFKSKEDQVKTAVKEKEELKELRQEIADMMEKKGNFDKQVEAELTRVRDDRVQGIKRILLNYAQLQKTFHAKNVAAMEDIVAVCGADPSAFKGAVDAPAAGAAAGAADAAGADDDDGDDSA